MQCIMYPRWFDELRAPRVARAYGKHFRQIQARRRRPDEGKLIIHPLFWSSQSHCPPSRHTTRHVADTTTLSALQLYLQYQGGSAGGGPLGCSEVAAVAEQL